MDISNAPKLSDFTCGKDRTADYYRHPDDEGIVFTTQREIFLAAARDVSCRAAIQHVSDEKRIKDRLTMHNAWKATPESDSAMVSFFYTHSVGPGFEMPEELEPTLGIIGEMAQCVYDMRGKSKTRTSIVGNWRVSSTDEHKPHGFEVLNRVFGEGVKGTVLPINIGHFQVEESDL